MNDNGKKKFRGWAIAASCFIMMGTIYTYNNLFGLFVKPLQQSLNASRTQISMLLAIATIAFMIACPFVGRIMKKVKLNKMMTLGVLLSGVSYLGFSIANNLISLYFFGIMSGLGLALCTIIPVNVMLQNWFVEKNGLITGIVFMGTGIGGVIFTQLVNLFMQSHDYRFSYLVMGIAAIIINLPFTLFVYKAHPAEVGQKAYGADSSKAKTEKAELQGKMLKDIKKKPEFISLLAAIFFLNLINICVISQYAAYLGDNGYNLKFITTIQTVYFIALIFTKILNGMLFDKIGSTATFTINSIAFSASIIILMTLVKSPSAMYAFAIALSFGASMVLLAPPILTRSFFGRKDYGNIFGIVTLVNMLGTAFGSPIVSFIYDTTGNYSLAWIILSILAIFMSVLIIFANSKAQKSASKNSTVMENAC